MTQSNRTQPPRRVLLGVTGGIAAYKACELTRLLKKAGAGVRVVMTPAAREFISPLSFQALSRETVHTALFDPDAPGGTRHLELARWADAIIVAPAGAEFLAGLAQGRAHDLLSAVCLASRARLYLAPAMNWAMWEHPATQANVRRLEERGASLLGPATGEMAEAETGPGRMLEPEAIAHALLAGTGGGLAGLRVLLTAGPTREPVDPVRFLTNRSSGRMGFALAESCAAAGAEVTLVAGPVAHATPPGCTRIDVETAREMHEAVMSRVADTAIFIGVAAVSDYRVDGETDRKIKKAEGGLASLALTENPDILADVAALDSGPFTVGFAAETHDVVANARRKLDKKHLDMISANAVGGTAGGFECETNALTVIWDGGSERLESAPKPTLARRLAHLIAERCHASADTGKDTDG